MTTAVETRAILGDHTEFSGRMTGRDLTILGHFEGAVELTGVLRIGRDGVVRAQIRAADVEVLGKFEGEIRAARLAFGESARAKGVFLADRFIIKEGALVDGAVNLPPAEVVVEAAVVVEPVPEVTGAPDGPASPPVEAAAAQAPAADATTATTPATEPPSDEPPREPDSPLAVAS